MGMTEGRRQQPSSWCWRTTWIMIQLHKTSSLPSLKLWQSQVWQRKDKRASFVVKFVRRYFQRKATSEATWEYTTSQNRSTSAGFVERHLHGRVLLTDIFKGVIQSHHLCLSVIGVTSRTRYSLC